MRVRPPQCRVRCWMHFACTMAAAVLMCSDLGCTAPWHEVSQAWPNKQVLSPAEAIELLNRDIDKHGDAGGGKNNIQEGINIHVGEGYFRGPSEWYYADARGINYTLHHMVTDRATQTQYKTVEYGHFDSTPEGQIAFESVWRIELSDYNGCWDGGGVRIIGSDGHCLATFSYYNAPANAQKANERLASAFLALCPNVK